MSLHLESVDSEEEVAMSSVDLSSPPGQELYSNHKKGRDFKWLVVLILALVVGMLLGSVIRDISH